MREVAIIGAGELGGATAHALARREVARRITLIDDHGRVAEGKALDITQAAPVERFSTQLAGATEFSRAAGAEVIVVADRFGIGEWQGEDALLLMRRLSQTAPGSVIVCAGASYCGLVDRGVREMQISRSRLFGSAPEALASAARALAALALDGSPRDIGLSVLGLPPAQMVIAWEGATVCGFALTRVLDEPARRRIQATIDRLWPPGPLALAGAATNAIAAIDGRSRQLVCCFVAPEPSAAGRTRTAALPVRLGPSGITEVMRPSLSVVEGIALDNAMLL